MPQSSHSVTPVQERKPIRSIGSAPYRSTMVTPNPKRHVTPRSFTWVDMNLSTPNNERSPGFTSTLHGIPSRATSGFQREKITACDKICRFLESKHYHPTVTNKDFVNPNGRLLMGILCFLLNLIDSSFHQTTTDEEVIHAFLKNLSCKNIPQKSCLKHPGVPTSAQAIIATCHELCGYVEYEEEIMGEIRREIRSRDWASEKAESAIDLDMLATLIDAYRLDSSTCGDQYLLDALGSSFSQRLSLTTQKSVDYTLRIESIRDATDECQQMLDTGNNIKLKIACLEDENAKLKRTVEANSQRVVEAKLNQGLQAHKLRDYEHERDRLRIECASLKETVESQEINLDEVASLQHSIREISEETLVCFEEHDRLRLQNTNLSQKSSLMVEGLVESFRLLSMNMSRLQDAQQSIAGDLRGRCDLMFFPVLASLPSVGSVMDEISRLDDGGQQEKCSALWSLLTGTNRDEFQRSIEQLSFDSLLKQIGALTSQTLLTRNELHPQLDDARRELDSKRNLLSKDRGDQKRSLIDLSQEVSHFVRLKEVSLMEIKTLNDKGNRLLEEELAIGSNLQQESKAIHREFQEEADFVELELQKVVDTSQWLVQWAKQFDDYESNSLK